MSQSGLESSQAVKNATHSHLVEGRGASQAGESAAFLFNAFVARRDVRELSHSGSGASQAGRPDWAPGGRGSG